MLHLPPGFVDQILVLATGVRHIRLTHRHVPSCRPAAIEVMRDRATARLRHSRLEANHLIPDPRRFGLGEDET